MSNWHRTVIHLLGVLSLPALAVAAPSPATKAMQVQLVDAGVLAEPASALIAPATPPKNANADLVPAPLPDPDVEAPVTEGQPSPTLNPALLSRKPEFQGNGFADYSNLDHGTDEKTKPAAGLNLSVPVK